MLRVASTIVWVLVLGFAGACAHGPPPPPAPPRQTNVGLQLSTFELGSGLRVVLVRDPRASEIQVTTRYQVGAADDPPAQPGMAHLVEHLMFQQILGGQSLYASLESVATSFNAATSHDATTFVARAAPEHLDKLLAIEAVRLGHRCTSIDDAAFEREREVVVNEVRQRDHAVELAGALRDAVYPAGHPYRRAVGGDDATVAAITRAEACAFADAHYAPGRAVLVVSGDLTAARLEASLAKLLGRIPRRAVAPPAPAHPPELTPRRAEVQAPLDTTAVLVAWALPADPALRARIRALWPWLYVLVDGEVRGRVSPIELGDERAPVLALLVTPGAGEEVASVIAGVERGAALASATFLGRSTTPLDHATFERVQQAAIHGLFATLEDGGERDERIARHVQAGRDAGYTLAAELRGVREMTRDDARRVALEHLAVDRAKVIVLAPREARRRGAGAVSLQPVMHDLGRRRDPPDPAGARQPLAGAADVRAPAGVTARTLRNGLRVVLLPLTSVPTVDIRLVFGAGTADEPATRRGAALVAARALTWDPRHLNDVLLFAAAGGSPDVGVGRDHTTFAVRGLDMHLDLLLAGARRWVRDGRYDEDADAIVAAMRRVAKEVDDEGPITDAWRAAVYGLGHPYVAAGVVRHTHDALSVDDAARFRAAYYTPDNATLVIAGGFDPVIADRWVDFLFADWTGRAAPRGAPRSALQPASIAKAEDTAQVLVRLAFPATGTRAQQLVAAAMLEDVASDVRHQLGASYGLDTTLEEARHANRYTIEGWVDTARLADALALLRDRLARLRADAADPADPDATARAFVAARARTFTRLRSIAGGAGGLAGPSSTTPRSGARRWRGSRPPRPWAG